jgi:hypothetical protein
VRKTEYLKENGTDVHGLLIITDIHRNIYSVYLSAGSQRKWLKRVLKHFNKMW